MKLVTQPASDSIAQAKRMADESARFNLGSIVRTINMPTLALMFLRSDMQDRLTFTLGGTKKIDGRSTVELRFAEHAMPRIIASIDAAPAGGRFWLEPDSGRVIRSELVVDSGNARAQITVTYGQRPKLAVWVPTSMDEAYDLAVEAGRRHREPEQRIDRLPRVVHELSIVQCGCVDDCQVRRELRTSSLTSGLRPQASGLRPQDSSSLDRKRQSCRSGSAERSICSNVSMSNGRPIRLPSVLEDRQHDQIVRAGAPGSEGVNDQRLARADVDLAADRLAAGAHDAKRPLQQAVIERPWGT